MTKEVTESLTGSFCSGDPRDWRLTYQSLLCVPGPVTCPLWTSVSQW